MDQGLVHGYRHSHKVEFAQVFGCCLAWGLERVRRFAEEGALWIRCSSLHEGNGFVRAHHRHATCVRGCLFVLALEDEGGVRGVVVVGRPVARGLQDGFTAEVTRLCTDGALDGCSMLLGAVKRACRAMGFRRLVSYCLAVEDGAAVRSAGFEAVRVVRAESWVRAGRGSRRELRQEKVRYEIRL